MAIKKGRYDHRPAGDGMNRRLYLHLERRGTHMIPRGDGHRLHKIQRCIIINAWQKSNHPLRRRRQPSM